MIMPIGLLELGEILLAASQRRLEAVSYNVANATTPGYRKTLVFEHALDEARRTPSIAVASEFAQGPLRATGRPFDLALSGPGFFQVRGEERLYYTRAGQFERTGEGRLVDAQGSALQTADGADLIVGAGHVEILSDGTVLEDEAPVARIGVFVAQQESALEAVSGAFFVALPEAMREASRPVVRQGALELSNVDMADEMLDAMSALRAAEVGARIVQNYDTLIGQTISTFGRGQR
jgi:flagellar basal-body rod protein FlgG